MQARHRCRFSLHLALFPLLFVAADWTQFRGPDGSGLSDAVDLPDKWTDSDGILWKVEVPGYGASSPIVLGDRVFLTYYNGYGLDEDEPGEEGTLRRHIACYDVKTGDTIWTTPFNPAADVHSYQGFQALHGYASSTPSTDGEHLYYFFGSSGVGAVSLDGQPGWNVSVGTKTHSWGTATSPVLYENLVIVNACVECGSLVAFDKSNGQEVWRADGIARAWSTPALVSVEGGGTELVVSAKKRLLAFDPATGEKLWWCNSMDDYICPTPIAHEGVVYAIGARRSSALAVKAGGRGDVTDTHVLWQVTKGSNVSSPVYHEGHLYWVHQDRGAAYCANAETGEIVYEERLSPRPGRIYASPVVADGKIYVVSRSKGVYVLAARPTFELLAHNPPLDDSIFNGSPAIVGNRLLIRSDKFLYCIGR